MHIKVILNSMNTKVILNSISIIRWTICFSNEIDDKISNIPGSYSNMILFTFGDIFTMSSLVHLDIERDFDESFLFALKFLYGYLRPTVTDILQTIPEV